MWSQSNFSHNCSLIVQVINEEFGTVLFSTYVIMKARYKAGTQTYRPLKSDPQVPWVRLKSNGSYISKTGMSGNFSFPLHIFNKKGVMSDTALL